MAASIRASEEGLQIVEQARKNKGWNKKATAWCYEAGGISPSTLDRFWARTPIKQEHFVAICKAVGIDYWQSIATPSAATSPTAKTNVPAVYNRNTWVERKEVTASVLDILNSSCRILAILGITGIGKTALVERIVPELEDGK